MHDHRLVKRKRSSMNEHFERFSRHSSAQILCNELNADAIHRNKTKVMNTLNREHSKQLKFNKVFFTTKTDAW